MEVRSHVGAESKKVTIQGWARCQAHEIDECRQVVAGRQMQDR